MVSPQRPALMISGMPGCVVAVRQAACVRRPALLQVWSLDDRAYVDTLFGHQADVLGIDARRAERVLTVGADHTCRVWKIPEESQLIYRCERVHHMIASRAKPSPTCLVSPALEHWLKCRDAVIPSIAALLPFGSWDHAYW